MDEYIALLKRHDWSFDYSDDYSVWKRGREDRDRLNSLQRWLDPDSSIWNQYAPESYRH